MLAELTLVAGGAAVGGVAVWLWSRRRGPTADTPAPPDELRPVLDAMQLGVTVTDSDGTIVYTNPADAAMHGWTPDELVGRLGNVFAPPTARKTVTTGELPSLKSWRREGMNIRKDGSVFPVRLRTDLVRDAEGKLQGFVTVCEDVTDEQRLRAAEAAGSLHDPLTDLANRTFFLELVSRATRRAERHAEYHFAVLHLDFARFKLINEGLGHDAGDTILTEVAERLRLAIRPNDVAARLAGDEFAILLDALRTPGDAATVAERVIAGLDAPYALQGREVYLTPTIGVAYGGSALVDAEQYLKDARAAMYSARAAGRSLYGVFEETVRRRATQRLQLETDLRKALDEEEFRAVYQPIVDLGSGRTVAFEALVRWQHHDRGMIPPADFIPAAEDTGLVVPMGWWMLEETCRQLTAWRAEFPANEVAVSVNLSVRQLRQPRLVERILEVLAAAALPPRFLKLEVTESMLMDDADAQIAILRRLREAGISVVIDDFGTGYSSLSYIQRFDFDVLKIDRSFLPTGGGTDGWDIVRMIIELAGDKKAKVVAEGVETERHAVRLRELGCDWAQGYFFARPLEPDAATARLRAELG
ncbi:MAG TPA: EAL domain-containing protein [Gemmatimonadales bacterium]|jgi:diguanylate cyclase (GGDEF)-like protein/PAS domain S-box-containing protein